MRIEFSKEFTNQNKTNGKIKEVRKSFLAWVNEFFKLSKYIEEKRITIDSTINILNQFKHQSLYMSDNSSILLLLNHIKLLNSEPLSDLSKHINIRGGNLEKGNLLFYLLKNIENAYWYYEPTSFAKLIEDFKEDLNLILNKNYTFFSNTKGSNGVLPSRYAQVLSKLYPRLNIILNDIRCIDGEPMDTTTNDSKIVVIEGMKNLITEFGFSNDCQNNKKYQEIEVLCNQLSCKNSDKTRKDDLLKTVIEIIDNLSPDSSGVVEFFKYFKNISLVKLSRSISQSAIFLLLRNRKWLSYAVRNVGFINYLLNADNLVIKNLDFQNLELSGKDENISAIFKFIINYELLSVDDALSLFINLEIPIRCPGNIFIDECCESETFNTVSSDDLGLFYLSNLDKHLNGTAYEGACKFDILNSIISALHDSKNQDVPSIGLDENLKNKLIKILEQFIFEFSPLVKTRRASIFKSLMTYQRLTEKIYERLLNLKDDCFLIDLGWTNSKSGHAVFGMFKHESIDDDILQFNIYNRGGGVFINNEKLAFNELPTHSSNKFRFDRTKINKYQFKFAMSSIIHSIINTESSCIMVENDSSVYEFNLKMLFESLVGFSKSDSSDNRKSPKSLQVTGTCAYKSFLAFADDYCDSMQYERLVMRIKLTSIVRKTKYMIEQPKQSELDIDLSFEAIDNAMFRLSKMYNKKAISKIEFQQFTDCLLSCKNQIENNKRLLSYSLNNSTNNESFKLSDLNTNFKAQNFKSFNKSININSVKQNDLSTVTVYKLPDALGANCSILELIAVVDDLFKNNQYDLVKTICNGFSLNKNIESISIDAFEALGLNDVKSFLAKYINYLYQYVYSTSVSQNIKSVNNVFVYVINLIYLKKLTSKLFAERHSLLRELFIQEVDKQIELFGNYIRKLGLGHIDSQGYFKIIIDTMSKDKTERQNYLEKIYDVIENKFESFLSATGSRKYKESLKTLSKFQSALSIILGESYLINDIARSDDDYKEFKFFAVLFSIIGKISELGEILISTKCKDLILTRYKAIDYQPNYIDFNPTNLVVGKLGELGLTKCVSITTLMEEFKELQNKPIDSSYAMPIVSDTLCFLIHHNLNSESIKSINEDLLLGSGLVNDVSFQNTLLFYPQLLPIRNIELLSQISINDFNSVHVKNVNATSFKLECIDFYRLDHRLAIRLLKNNLQTVFAKSSPSRLHEMVLNYLNVAVKSIMIICQFHYNEDYQLINDSISQFSASINMYVKSVESEDYSHLVSCENIIYIHKLKQNILLLEYTKDHYCSKLNNKPITPQLLLHYFEQFSKIMNPPLVLDKYDDKYQNDICGEILRGLSIQMIPFYELNDQEYLKNIVNSCLSETHDLTSLKLNYPHFHFSSMKETKEFNLLSGRECSTKKLCSIPPNILYSEFFLRLFFRKPNVRIEDVYSNSDNNHYSFIFDKEIYHLIISGQDDYVLLKKTVIGNKEIVVQLTNKLAIFDKNLSQKNELCWLGRDKANNRFTISEIDNKNRQYVIDSMGNSTLPDFVLDAQRLMYIPISFSFESLSFTNSNIYHDTKSVYFYNIIDCKYEFYYDFKSNQIHPFINGNIDYSKTLVNIDNSELKALIPFKDFEHPRFIKYLFEKESGLHYIELPRYKLNFIGTYDSNQDKFNFKSIEYPDYFISYKNIDIFRENKKYLLLQPLIADSGKPPLIIQNQIRLVETGAYIEGRKYYRPDYFLESVLSLYDNVKPGTYKYLDKIKIKYGSAYVSEYIKNPNTLSKFLNLKYTINEYLADRIKPSSSLSLLILIETFIHVNDFTSAIKAARDNLGILRSIGKNLFITNIELFTGVQIFTSCPFYDDDKFKRSPNYIALSLILLSYLPFNVNEETFESKNESNISILGKLLLSESKKNISKFTDIIARNYELYLQYENNIHVDNRLLDNERYKIELLTNRAAVYPLAKTNLVSYSVNHHLNKLSTFHTFIKNLGFNVYQKDMQDLIAPIYMMIKSELNNKHELVAESDTYYNSISNDYKRYKSISDLVSIHDKKNEVREYLDLNNYLSSNYSDMSGSSIAPLSSIHYNGNNAKAYSVCSYDLVHDLKNSKLNMKIITCLEAYRQLVVSGVDSGLSNKISSMNTNDEFVKLYNGAENIYNSRINIVKSFSNELFKLLSDSNKDKNHLINCLNTILATYSRANCEIEHGFNNKINSIIDSDFIYSNMIKSGKFKIPNIKDFISCLANSDAKSFFDKFYFVNKDFSIEPSLLEQFTNDAILFMRSALVVNQIMKIIALLSGDLELKEKANILLDLLVSESMYSVYDFPNYLAFEYANNTYLRSYQVNILKEFNNNLTGYKLYKQFAGSGKTKFILPLMAMTESVVIIVPKNNIATNIQDLIHSMSFMNNKSVFNFKFDRNKIKNDADMFNVLSSLIHASHNKNIIIMDPVAVKSVYLMLKDYMVRDPNSKAYYMLKIIYQFFKNSIAVADEVHKVLDNNEKLIYSTVNQHPNDDNESNSIQMFFELAVKLKIHDKIIIDLISTISIEQYDELKVRLAELIHDEILIKHPTVNSSNIKLDRNLILSYLLDKCTLNNHVIDYSQIYNHESLNIKIILSSFKEIINKSIPLVIIEKANIKYGIPNTPSEFLAIPYEGNLIPKTGSYFGNVATTKFLTLFYLLTTDSKNRPSQYLKVLHKHYLLVLNRIAFDAKIIKEDLMINIFKLNKIDILNQYESLNDDVKLKILYESPDLILFLVSKYVFPKICTHENVLEASDKDFVKLFKGFHGLSATVSGWRNFSKIDFDDDSGLYYDGEVISHMKLYIEKVILDSQEEPASIDSNLLSDLKNAEFFYHYIKNLNGQKVCNALIDNGAFFEGVESSDVAKKLSIIFKNLNIDIRYILFWGSDNILKALEINNPDIELLIRSSSPDNIKNICRCDMKYIFTYYDHAHTLGMDITRNERSHALLTMDKVSISDFIQSFKRMRNTGAGDTLDLILSNISHKNKWEYYSTISTEHILQNLINEGIVNDAQSIMDDYHISLLASIKSLISHFVFETLLNIEDLKKRESLIKKYNRYLIDRSPANAYERAGLIMHSIDANLYFEEINNKALEEISEICSDQELNILDKKSYLKTELLKIILRYKGRCNKVIKMLPSGFNDSEVTHEHQIHFYNEANMSLMSSGDGFKEKIQRRYKERLFSLDFKKLFSYSYNEIIELFKACKYNEILNNHYSRFSPSKELKFYDGIFLSRDLKEIFAEQDLPYYNNYRKSIHAILYIQIPGIELGNVLLSIAVSQYETKLLRNILNVEFTHDMGRFVWLETISGNMLCGIKPSYMYISYMYETVKVQFQFINGNCGAVMNTFDPSIWLFNDLKYVKHKTLERFYSEHCSYKTKYPMVSNQRLEDISKHYKYTYNKWCDELNFMTILMHHILSLVNYNMLVNSANIDNLDSLIVSIMDIYKNEDSFHDSFLSFEYYMNEYPNGAHFLDFASVSMPRLSLSIIINMLSLYRSLYSNSSILFVAPMILSSPSVFENKTDLSVVDLALEMSIKSKYKVRPLDIENVLPDMESARPNKIRRRALL